MIRSAISSTLRRRKLPSFLQSSSRRNHHRQHAVAAAVGATDDEASATTSWVFFAAGAFAFASTTSASAWVQTTRCDDDDNDDSVEEDPYDNLPEEDQPTHCSICLTYRQGPCRPYWRKIEACTKDHELKKDDDDDDDDDDGEKKEDDDKTDEQKKEKDLKGNDDKAESPDLPCLKYMMPWIDCATSYRNLYNLIEMDTNYTMGIQDLEEEATQTLCWAPGYEPKIDWSAWQDYVKHHDWTLPKTDSPKKGVPLWKTLDYEAKGDPKLCEITAKVDMKLEQGVLECAYAVDQDGNVIGFAYGIKPSEMASSAEKEKDNEEEQKKELTIRILPNYTTSITLAASYTQQKKANADKDFPFEAHVYKSRPYPLESMVEKKKKTKTAKKKKKKKTKTAKSLRPVANE